MTWFSKAITIADLEQDLLQEAELAVLRTEEAFIRAKIEFEYQVERVKRAKRSIAVRKKEEDLSCRMIAL